MSLLKHLIIVLLVIYYPIAQSATIPDTDDYYYYDYETDTESCKCKNGGICVLDNDFCVCPPNFTGRHCEIDLTKQQFKSCGNLLDGESEFIGCSKCTCTDQFITCKAMSTLSCDRFSASDAGALRGAPLPKLMKLVIDIENDAYAVYVNSYVAKTDYVVTSKNVNDKKNMLSPKAMDNGKKQLVVFQDNGRVLSLYFPSNEIDNIQTSGSNLINASYLIVATVLICSQIF